MVPKPAAVGAVPMGDVAVVAAVVAFAVTAAGIEHIWDQQSPCLTGVVRAEDEAAVLVRMTHILAVPVEHKQTLAGVAGLLLRVDVGKGTVHAASGCERTTRVEVVLGPRMARASAVAAAVAANKTKYSLAHAAVVAGGRAGVPELGTAVVGLVSMDATVLASEGGAGPAGGGIEAALEPEAEIHVGSAQSLVLHSEVAVAHAVDVGVVAAAATAGTADARHGHCQLEVDRTVDESQGPASHKFPNLLMAEG